MIRLALFLLCLAVPLKAEEIVLGLSKDAVAITANFNGSDLLIFGAIKRQEPIPDTSVLGVIITVSGPNSSVVVRRKERRFGIWLNTDSVEVDLAPSYYAVASSAPLGTILKDIEDLRYAITVPRAIRSVGARVTGTEKFTEALIRVREQAGLYDVLEGAIDFEESTLFSTTITLPAKLTEGDYKTRIFLTRNGEVIDEYDTVIPVNKVGVERWLFDLSLSNPYFYGIMSLILAAAAGWLAAAVFARIRR